MSALPQTANAIPAALTIAGAQRDMRHAYMDGAPGVLTSGTAWFVAGMACMLRSPAEAVWALFIGGMLIHPVALVLLKLFGRPAAHARANPLGTLAFMTTLWMILSLPLAYAVSLLRIDWFFPAMLFVFGGRYLTFATLYGMRIYLLFGAVLALAGYALGAQGAGAAAGAFAGAAIEIGFGAFMLATARRGRVG
jgi:hypothetical protein